MSSSWLFLGRPWTCQIDGTVHDHPVAADLELEYDSVDLAADAAKRSSRAPPNNATHHRASGSAPGTFTHLHVHGLDVTPGWEYLRHVEDAAGSEVALGRIGARPFFK